MSQKNCCQNGGHGDGGCGGGVLEAATEVKQWNHERIEIGVAWFKVLMNLGWLILANTSLESGLALSMMQTSSLDDITLSNGSSGFIGNGIIMMFQSHNKMGLLLKSQKTVTIMDSFNFTTTYDELIQKMSDQKFSLILDELFLLHICTLH